MPSLETPPNPAPPSTPVRVRTNRYGDLEEHELIHLLETIDDERSRARFRESVYISIIIWLAIGWFVLISDKDRTQQTVKPTLDKKTLEQLQAMRKARAPGAAAAPPTPQPPQQTASQPAPQQQPAPQPLPQHPPQQQAMVDAPRPAPTRPNFGNQPQSAGDAIRQAAQQAAQNRGQGGDYGANSPVAHQGAATGVEVLSDTMGVDFAPYLRRILSDIKRTWIPLIPEEARPPLNKQGETLIRFIILPDGRVGAMNLDGSTQDEAIDRAAWGAIKGNNPFPPLPNQFHGPQLELRIRFLVNKTPE